LAGASTWFALKKRPPSAYIKERFLRLIVPLVFGILVIVPPQTFYERIQKLGFSGNYLDFYAHLFNGLYPQGNLQWCHLWFLFYLFCISLCALPLILRWKSGKGASFLEPFCKWLAEGRRIFLLSLPLAIIQMTLKVPYPGPQIIVTDWARILFMLFIFLYGVLFYRFSWFQESLERNLKVALVAGAVISICYLGLYFFGYRFVNGYNLPNLAQLGLNSLATLCWLIVLLSFGQGTLNFSNHFLDYASEAVLPIYIIHQTVIIILGYYIVETEFNLIAKFAIINIVSFIIIIAIYDILVRRFNIMRTLLGMRPIQKKIS